MISASDWLKISSSVDLAPPESSCVLRKDFANFVAPLAMNDILGDLPKIPTAERSSSALIGLKKYLK